MEHSLIFKGVNEMSRKSMAMMAITILMVIGMFLPITGQVSVALMWSDADCVAVGGDHFDCQICPDGTIINIWHDCPEPEPEPEPEPGPVYHPTAPVQQSAPQGPETYVCTMPDGTNRIWLVDTMPVGSIFNEDGIEYRTTHNGLCELVTPNRGQGTTNTQYPVECFGEVILAETQPIFLFSQATRIDGSQMVAIHFGRDPNTMNCYQFAYASLNGQLWISSHDGSIKNPVTYRGEGFTVSNVASNGDDLIAVVDATGKIHVMDAYLLNGRASFDWVHNVEATDLAMAPDGPIAYVENGQIFLASANGNDVYALGQNPSEVGMNFSANGQLLIFAQNGKTMELNLINGTVRQINEESFFVEEDPHVAGSQDAALASDWSNLYLATFTGDHLVVGQELFPFYPGMIFSPNWWHSDSVVPVNILESVDSWATRVS